jgi:acyl carrier protein
MSQVDEKDVRSFIVRYLSDKLTAEDLQGILIDNDSFDFSEYPAFDSLGIIQMIAEMENTLHIKVDFESMDPDEFTVLGTFTRYVAKMAKNGD